MTTTIVNPRDGLKIVRQSLAVSSATYRQAIDVTPQVLGAVHGAGVASGLVIANCLVNDDAPYKHNDACLSDCERGNAAAHLRATLLGHGVAVGVTNRQMHIQIMGV